MTPRWNGGENVCGVLLKGVNFCVIFAISQRISEKKRKMCFRYGKIQNGGWKPNKTIEVVSRTFLVKTASS